MKSSFLRNLFFSLSLNLLVKPFWILGIDRMIQNHVGTNVYGIYFSLFNLSMFFYIVIDMGITNYNNKSLSHTPNNLSTYLPKFLFLKIIFSLIYIVLTLLVVFYLDLDSSVYPILVGLVLNQILQSFILYLRSNISAWHYFKIDSFMSVFDRVLMIIFCGILLWTPAFKSYLSIQNFIYIQTFCYALSIFFLVVIHFFLFRQRIASMRRAVFSYKAIMKEVFPYALLGVFMTLYYRVDGIMISKTALNGAYQAGVYAASFRLLDGLSMVGFLFASLILPMCAKALDRGESIVEIIRSSYRLLGVFSLTISLSCFLYAEQIIYFLYPQATQQWVEVFKILIMVLNGISLMYIFGTLLMAGGHIRLMTQMAFIGLIINISSNLVLIHFLGAIGASWTTLITQFFIAVLFVYWSHKKYQTFFLKDGVRLFCLAFLMLGIYFLFDLFDIPWIGAFIALNLVGLGFSFCLRLYNVYTFVSLLKAKSK